MSEGKVIELDGKKIDKWLAENFRMGDGSLIAPKPYSADMSAAWELMTIMANRGKRPRITRVSGNEWACAMDLDESACYSSSAPLAICQAVILELTI